MSGEYYLEKLYPLQDRVLQVLREHNTPHYLTGGTALSKCYLNHRFSDDLDLFLNYDPQFQTATANSVEILKQSFDQVNVGIADDAYFRVFVSEGEVNLKIDFVNDVGFHFNGFEEFGIYGKVDNVRNILSNKLTALERQQAKDIVDIIFIARFNSFSWKDIVKEASMKDMWVNEVDILNYLASFRLEEKVGEIAWMQECDVEALRSHLNVIMKDIVVGGQNSLVG
jgi:predicted nucleotidyltransferase component of viral defense system